MSGDIVRIPLFYMSPQHCSQARSMLGWDVQRLSNASGASQLAIEQYESGIRKLRSITLQAIAFAFEEQALIFFPGHPPMVGDNARGACPDPRQMADIGLIE